MMGLMVFGKLEQATTFPVKDVTPEMIANISSDIKSGYSANAYYVDLIAPLEAQGRQDLVQPLGLLQNVVSRTDLNTCTRNMRGVLYGTAQKHFAQHSSKLNERSILRLYDDHGYEAASGA